MIKPNGNCRPCDVNNMKIDDREVLYIRVDKNLKDKLREAARSRSMTLNEYANAALAEVVEGLFKTIIDGDVR